jgi:quinolinate synthase
MPHIDAGCPMADMVNVKSLREFKARHEGAAVVTYVNSSAEVKAESDYCCTSANAEEVVKRIPEEDVIFVPDKNLAFYVQRQVPEKNIIPWDGFCPVHQVLTKEYLKEKLKDFPECKIIAHPECRSEILDMADHIASTSGMIDCARKDEAKDFFILTECGMVERLKRELPEKNFHSFCNICFDMKKNSLESVYKCLRDEKPVVKVDPEVAKKAKLAFDRMFDLFK